MKLAPGFLNARITLGTIYQKMDRYRDAEREYTQARRLHPRSSQALENLGSLYIQEADAALKREADAVGEILDHALDVLEEAVKISPRSANAHYLLGTANYKSTFYEEADQSLQRAIELDAQMGSARLMLANLYMRQKKWEKALQNLDAYLAGNPKASDRSQIQETRAKVEEQLTRPR